MASVSETVELEVIQQPVAGDLDLTEHDSDTTISQLQQVITTFQLSTMNFVWNCSKGLIIVSLPKITVDLDIDKSLAFWPSSAPALTTASTLLVAGTVADIIGPKFANLTGGITIGVFMLACGFSRNGEELVLFRALSGLGAALHLSSAVALVTQVYPPSRGRNISFACLGLSQVLGFSFGLVVGGVLVQSLTWRSGWYIQGAVAVGLPIAGFWFLPQPRPREAGASVLVRLITQGDWIGVLLSSAFMALLSYFLA